MTNGWIRQAYLQDFEFEFESVTFNQVINMFENVKVAESIYEGVVETSYKTKLQRNNTPMMVIEEK